jgi:polycomb protein EED
MLWKPFTQQQEDGFTALKEFEFTEGEIWFIKFGLNASATSVAVGNKQGKIWVWNLATGKCQKLQHPQCRRAIRQIAFGPDGRYGGFRGGAAKGGGW